MAALATGPKNRVKRTLMRYWSRVHESVAFNENVLGNAIDHADQWLDGNTGAVSQNEGLNVNWPAVFKSNATNEQKQAVMCAVQARRVSLNFFNEFISDGDTSEA